MADGFRTLDDFIFEKISDSKLPGLSIAAVLGGEVVYKRGFGFRDLSKGLPATPESLYCIGSVTKSFTCLAVMQLHEKGLLSVEDDIGKYVPLRIRPKGEAVRIWHLMSHTSGIPALAYAEAVIRQAMKSADKWLPMAGYEDMFTFMDGADDWVQSKPGDRWFYLNEGYILLGYIIEKVSGEKYVDYVRRHILEPLGMSRSYFKREDVDADPNVATPYIVTRDGERIPSTYPYGTILSDGGLISNAMDMVNYVDMYLNKGQYNGKRLVNEGSLTEMMKPRVRVPDEPFISGYIRHYGFGLGINSDFLGYDLVSHGGSVTTATAYMGFIPDKGVGVVILANGTGYPLNFIGEYALALLMDEDPNKLPVVRYERVLDELSGVYETYKETMRAKVIKRGSLLVLDTGDKYRDVLVPLIPADWEGETKVFHGISMDRKVPAEFFKEGKDQFLIYERYKMKKTGKI